jgi:serine/threonine protein kinase
MSNEILNIEFSFEDCKLWITNKNINPKTGRKIQKNGPTWEKLSNACEKYKLSKSQTSKSQKTSSTDIIFNEVIDFSITSRYYMYKIMNKILKNNYYNKCFKDLIGEVFEDDIRKIGNGSFGIISVVSPKKANFEIALKETKIDSYEFKRYSSKNLNEQVILPLFTKIVLQNFIQNYPITYSMNLCKNNDKKKTIDIYLERMDGSIDELIYKDDITNKLLENIFVQCFISVVSAQHLLGLIHKDIKSQNFLYKKIPVGGHWVYNFRGTEYYIENLGYIVFLNDFGVSHLARPKYAFKGDLELKEYGIRPIRVFENNIELINYKYNITIGKKNKIKKINRTSIYSALLTDKYDLEADIVMDLENLDEFPPIEFSEDIVDVIRTFIGGQRTRQSGNHKSTKIKRKMFLENYSVDSNVFKIIKLNRYYLLSGNEMMKILFKKRTIPLDSKENARFVIPESI